MQGMSQNSHQEQLQSSIAKALLYSDIFSYPLTAEEVFLRLPTNHTSVDEVKQTLGTMIEKGIVFRFGDFFTIRNERNLEARRTAGNKRASMAMPRAFKRGRFLSKFPFIRSVMISGSLSKNYMDEDSDVDYFVITSPGRLWIARFFVAAFKRIFLFNSHKRFCVNYYIDDAHLEIEEKNIFTATELVTLVPVAGIDTHSKLIENNRWVLDFFPNQLQESGRPLFKSTNHWLKSLIEAVIEPIGDSIDNHILRLALRRYRNQYASKFTSVDFNIAFKSRKDVSKNHDRHFQKHITELFDQKVERFQRDNRQSLVA
jgi:hypothetical protein